MIYVPPTGVKHKNGKEWDATKKSPNSATYARKKKLKPTEFEPSDNRKSDPTTFPEDPQWNNGRD